MRQRLKILVEIPDPKNIGSYKELYRNQLLLDDSVNFDFQTILSALKILYPDEGVFISFMIG